MKRGKDICNTLKQIRLDIARANGIKYVPRECHHEDDCACTCPACESEVRYLEREIARRRSHGKAALIAGVSLGLMSFTATSCDQISETVRELIHHDEQLRGEVTAEDVQWAEDSLSNSPADSLPANCKDGNGGEIHPEQSLPAVGDD